MLAKHCEMKWKSLSRLWLFVTSWTIQSMEFSRPEYWSGYPFPSPGNLPNPGIEPRSPTLSADSLPAEPHKWSPRILEWVAYPFSRRYFQPRNQTGVSCIAGKFFTNWAIREAQNVVIHNEIIYLKCFNTGIATFFFFKIDWWLQLYKINYI